MASPKQEANRPAACPFPLKAVLSALQSISVAVCVLVGLVLLLFAAAAAHCRRRRRRHRFPLSLDLPIAAGLVKSRQLGCLMQARCRCSYLSPNLGHVASARMRVARSEAARAPFGVRRAYCSMCSTDTRVVVISLRARCAIASSRASCAR